MKIKVIKNHRISPLLYKKRYYKLFLFPAMLGAIGCIVFFFKLVYAETSDSVEFTKIYWIGLGVSAFILFTCMQFGTTFLVSSTLIGIIESIVNENESEQKSLSEDNLK